MNFAAASAGSQTLCELATRLYLLLLRIRSVLQRTFS